MTSSFFPSSVVIRTIDLSSDAPQPLANRDIPFYTLDVQCLTNPISLGIAGKFDFKLNVGETYWTYNANMRDFMFQNFSSGNNGAVALIATVPNAYVEQALKTGYTRF